MPDDYSPVLTPDVEAMSPPERLAYARWVYDDLWAAYSALCDEVDALSVRLESASAELADREAVRLGITAHVAAGGALRVLIDDAGSAYLCPVRSA
jgi:hypothetical protein